MAGNATAHLRALVFDVFGTVVDYRGTIIREGIALNAAKGLAVDWAAFADAWRAEYRPNMDRVARGELPWLNLDALNRMALDTVLDQFGAQALTDDERERLNRVWHRLTPWPDAVAGLRRLRQHYTLATLSNGNIALLVEMAKHSGLPWDCIFSAEWVHAYKPDPRTYQMTYSLLALQPEQVMLVAAHPSDLRAARSCGLRTAYVRRPHETGSAAAAPDLENPEVASFDVRAADFTDLAAQLIAENAETKWPTP